MVVLAGVLLLFAGAYFGESAAENPEQPAAAVKESPSVAADTLSPREAMLLGLIIVESKGNPRAVSSAGARGILQLMPVYVDEANRISRIEGLDVEYSFDDAFDPQKSVEMFLIVSGRHCGTSDDAETIAKTIRRHNPRAGEWYSQRVYRAMAQVQSDQSVRTRYSKYLAYL